MTGYVLRRLAQGLVAIALVTITVFVVTRMVVDPVTVMLPAEATDSQRAALAERLGVDRPIPQQFVSYVAGVVRLDFGDSLWHRRPAMDIVFEKLPNTIVLSGAAIGLAIVLALPLGTAAALRPNSLRDRIVTTTGLVGLSLPAFWLGLMLIIVFSVSLGWLPTGGLGGLKHLALPAFTLALPIAGRIAIFSRSTMIDELNRPWIKVAHSKGLPRRRVVGVHCLRNAAVPILSLVGWEFIGVISGSAVVESVFAWPGLGRAALQAVQQSDLVLLQTIVLVVATLTVLVNITIDLIYKAIDPRIQLSA